MRDDASRSAILIWLAAGTFSALPVPAGAQASTPRPTPTPAPCARPNLPATVVHQAPVMTPPMAEQQGIQGTVQVVISLDEYSRVVATRIQASPNALLNATALAAARASTFQTEIRDCRPLAANYIYAVEFTNRLTFATSASGERTVSVVGEGTVSRRAENAYVRADIVTHGDTGMASAAQNDAVFAALNAKLAALGLEALILRNTIPVRSESGYASMRSVGIAVDNVANVDRTVAAASSVVSVEVIGIHFTLRNLAAARRQALELALKDAEHTVRIAVPAQELAVIRQVVVPPDDGGRPPAVDVPFRLVPVAGGFTQPPVRVPNLAVRAMATVTYAIAR